MPPTNPFNKTTPLTPAPSRKRPKFAPGSGTPRQRAIMLAVAAACLVTAFLIPVGKDDPDTRGFEEAVEQKAPPAPPIAAQTPASLIPRDATLGRSSRDPNFPPLQEVTSFAPTTPQEIDQRLDLLTRYYSHSDSKESAAAYKATLALGPELISRLPALIEKAPATALVNYVLAARDLKALNTVPALIARLEAKDKSRAGQFEMFAALASFDDAKARAYVTAAMKASPFLPRETVWDALGEGMDATQSDLALQTAAGGGPECFMAAKALARYGKTYEHASAMAQRIQPLLNTAKGDARLALVQALAGMEPNVAGNALTALSYDADRAIRGAALAGLARCPLQQGLAINAFRNEEEFSVKAAILGAFVEAPCDAILPDALKLLNDTRYQTLAHAVLRAANKGRDLGMHDFDWMEWLKDRTNPRKPVIQAEKK